ncbi:pyocin knob domain-containing protein [Paenibacillus radicis (ex Gao et al. 2016)]|uniref:Putative tail fiber protein gp53-like C-terminal domain-containing protein n=1 Tax=Paenibacillus radicis (ex Gao et al. 2016) TaxID=1737354 RepID=A0A917M8E5_9BACL|nr:pyocin knob domain-containing protein [Paenibacillus radicis (ex Gao et al. 2016)]GGG81712.1 hypothetical protein GCM10010918_43770 [Paenibacillus radicis (ex Gao et al. 2016)]
MASNTENLDLLKKNPVTDGNETFNIKTMLNDNWDKLDAVVGDMSSVQTVAKDAAGAIKELHSFLGSNNESFNVASIKSGDQIIQGGNVSALAFPRIEGRTMINLLGGISKFNHTIGMSSTHINYTKVNSSEEIVVNCPDASKEYYAYYENANSLVNLKSGKYVMAMAEVKVNEVLPGAGELKIAITGLGSGPIDKTKLGIWQNVFFKTYVPNNNYLCQVLIGTPYAEASKYLKYSISIKNVRLFELSPAEFAAIDNMQADLISSNYPHVGTGVYGVKDAKVTGIQGNLLPSFNEWTLHEKSFINEPYKMTLLASENNSVSFYDFQCLPNTDYTLSFETGTGLYSIHTIDWKVTIKQWSNSTFTFNSGNYRKLRIGAGNFTSGAGTYTFRNPILVQGTIAVPFRSQQKTAITAYTELFGNVENGVCDTVEFIGGKPKKNKKWEKITLDGSLPWTYGEIVAGKDNKPVYFTNTISSYTPFDESAVMIKSDGKLLKNNGKYSWQASGFPTDSFNMWSDNQVYVHVPNSDSGWGDLYTPSADEIKAYFNGWRLLQQDGQNYNGTGTKYWNKINPDGTAALGQFTTTLPTEMANTGIKQYNLLYQLARPVLEDIQIGGALVLEAGVNHINTISVNVPVISGSILYANNVYSTFSKLSSFLANQFDREDSIMLPGKTDLNSLIRNGKYCVYDGRNAPSKIVAYYVEVINFPLLPHEGTMQIAYKGDSNRLFTRRLMGSPAYWTKWSEVITTETLVADSNLVSNGYQKLASGLIIQWGTVSVPNNTSTRVTYPIAYPVNIVNVTATIIGGGGVGYTVALPGVTLAQLEVYQSSGSARQISWMTMGY